MEAGQWYSCLDPELSALRDAARHACFEHRMAPVSEAGGLSAALAGIFDAVGQNTLIEAPFHCSYGRNIQLGRNVYVNANCVILDSGVVTIGDGTMIGPSVQIYCADHHRDAEKRRKGIERALPVAIGRDVWIGGGAILLPGVSVGDAAIVGAGAVVTRDVPAGARVVGNPARILP